MADAEPRPLLREVKTPGLPTEGRDVSETAVPLAIALIVKPL